MMSGNTAKSNKTGIHLMMDLNAYLAPQFMRASEIYTIRQKVWGILMFLTLLWLTVSLPFVYDAQQKLAKISTMATPVNDNPVENGEDANPLSSSVEEKVPSNTSILEEYLHHDDESFFSQNPGLSHIDKHSSDLYLAFHGELLSPPPESLLS